MQVNHVSFKHLEKPWETFKTIQNLKEKLRLTTLIQRVSPRINFMEFSIWIPKNGLTVYWLLKFVTVLNQRLSIESGLSLMDQ